MSLRQTIAILLFLFLFASCSSGDGEEIIAMRFLTRNMSGKYTLDTESVSSNSVFFRTLAEYCSKPGFSPVTGLYEVADSLEKALGKPMAAPTYSFDADNVGMDYLEGHVQESMQIWNASPWKDEIPFDIFLRYVLPYKAGTEFWDGAGDFIRQKYSDSLETWASLSLFDAAERIISAVSSGFISDGQFFREHPYMYATSFENTVRTGLGECNDHNAAIVAALRAFGIPATINTVPYWGNSNASHFWTEVIGAPKRPLYDNSQVDFHSAEEELVSDSFWFKGGIISDTTGIPAQVKLRKNRTVSKIYRKNFEINRKSLAVKSRETIPPFFRDPGLEDITSSRVETRDVKIRLRHRHLHHRYAYLCCYSPSDASWTPVAWARNILGRACFKDMGVNVLYMAAVFSDEGISTDGDPFLLRGDGSLRYLSGTSRETDSLTVFSKVPLRTNFAYYAMLMRGDRILAARKADLADTVLVHAIDSIPYYTRELDLAEPVLARYVLLCTGSTDPKFVAELECSKRGPDGTLERLTGTPFGNPCFSRYPLADAFDGDPLTYSFLDKREGNAGFIGLDLGHEAVIDRISFCPRNDDNAIIPGDDYELFCWRDGRWLSLGRQAGGRDRRLHYAGIPRDALLRVHDHTRGKENRPFTLEDGIQVWW